MKERLEIAALESFLASGYRQASVARICREAGAANGSFYQYFPDKEALFLELWDRLQALLLSDLRAATGRAFGLKGRVEAAVAALSELLLRESGLFQVFREAEFVATRASQSFYRLLERELPAVVGVPGVHPAALTYFVLGAVYFNVVSRAVWGSTHHPLPTVVDFVLRGMAPDRVEAAQLRLAAAAAVSEGEMPPSPAPDAPVGRAEATRQRLLDAAEAQFGASGYHDCRISHITDAAEVGQGTFYLYFPTKQAALEEVVRRINRRLKRAVAHNVLDVEHHLTAEVVALRAFLGFALDHRSTYRVVRETEFVQRDLGRWHYLDVAEGYLNSLELAMTAGQVRVLDPFALGLSIMGVAHHLGLRWPVWEGSPVPAEVLIDTVDLMMRGVLGVSEAAGTPT